MLLLWVLHLSFSREIENPGNGMREVFSREIPSRLSRQFPDFKRVRQALSLCDPLISCNPKCIILWPSELFLSSQNQKPIGKIVRESKLSSFLVFYKIFVGSEHFSIQSILLL